MISNAVEDSSKKFIQEFGADLMIAHGFDERAAFGIDGQGVSADPLTGEVFLYVTLRGDVDRRPLQLVEMPFFSPEWNIADARAALEEHLGLSEEEAGMRLRRAGLFKEAR